MKKRLQFVVLFVLLVLAGLAGLFGYAMGFRNAFALHSDTIKLDAARGRALELAAAISNYHNLNKVWPCKKNGSPDFVFAETNQWEVISILLNQDSTMPAADASKFVIDIHAFRGSNYVDPWGVPYFILMDRDHDGICRSERWGVLPGNGPFVWSEGSGVVKSW